MIINHDGVVDDNDDAVVVHVDDDGDNLQNCLVVNIKGLKLALVGHILNLVRMTGVWKKLLLWLWILAKVIMFMITEIEDKPKS